MHEQSLGAANLIYLALKLLEYEVKLSGDRVPRRAPVEEKSPISMESLRALLEALPEPSRSIATLLAMTGLRVGELLALRWQDIDFDRNVFSVRQTVYEGHFDTPKSKRSKRTLPLGPVCRYILESLRKPNVDPSALVFSARNGAPLSRRNLLNRQLRPTCNALGLKGANWHWLRHAHATMLDSVGTPLGTVQALLGHASSETTREIYIESLTESARPAVESVEKLLGPKWTQPLEWPEMGSSLVN